MFSQDMKAAISAQNVNPREAKDLADICAATHQLTPQDLLYAFAELQKFFYWNMDGA